MSKLTIVAHVIAKPDKMGLVKAELNKLVEMVSGEKGCLQYDLHQDNINMAHFMFYENWESRELWMAHMDDQPVKDFLAATDGAVEELSVYEMTHLV